MQVWFQNIDDICMSFSHNHTFNSNNVINFIVELIIWLVRCLMKNIHSISETVLERNNADLKEFFYELTRTTSFVKFVRKSALIGKKNHGYASNRKKPNYRLFTWNSFEWNSWICALKHASKRKLDCKQSRVDHIPVAFISHKWWTILLVN